MAAELVVPVLHATHDAGLARDDLPRAGARSFAGGRTDRGRGRQCEDVVAVEAMVDPGAARLGELEDATEQPAGHGVVHAAMIGAGGRDAGGVELFAERAGIRVLHRMENRHPFEGHTGLGPPQHFAHDRPDFFVGIGRRDHAGRPRQGGPLLGEVVAQDATERLAGPVIGTRVAGERQHGVRAERAGNGSEECTGGLALIEGTTEHDGCVVVEAAFEREVRPKHHLVLVVMTDPIGLEVGGDGGDELQQIGRLLGGGRAEHRPLFRMEFREFAVRPHQRGLGGHVLGHAGESAGFGAQHVADGRRENGGGERTSAGSGELRRSEATGELERRGEGDVRDPTRAEPGAGVEPVGSEESAKAQPGEVGGHDDGDRPKRVAALSGVDGSADREGEGAAGPGLYALHRGHTTTRVWQWAVPGRLLSWRRTFSEANSFPAAPTR